MTDQPPKRGTLATSAYDALRHGIITTELAPGARLHTRALCDQFKIGLSPVREALSRLVSDGLVIQRDHHGFAVAPLSQSDLEDLNKARCWLNEIGLRESIRNGGPEWEEQLLLSFHRMTRTPRHLAGTGEVARNPAWEAAHKVFHASLLSACGSTWLLAFCEQLFDAAERYRHLARIAGVVRAENEDEHRAIMQAALDRDQDRACQLLTRHFERTAALVKKVIGVQMQSPSA
jgi:DNA-binding GntR family transcriptional regulator